MRVILALAIGLCACARKPATEADLRKKLGVPEGAKTVVIFAQTSHLDIDWQKTFDGYYDTWVENIFLDARKLLESQPRAFYSVAEMAFLQHHVARHPEELAALKAQAASGALRIVGGGMTSPDTALPETELLMRDFLYGARFAEDTLGVRPRAAWLPDSFGHAATAPDLLAAAGFTSVALGRIDGAPALWEQIAKNIHEPKPGSTAGLLRQLGSADFFWRGPGGGRVLAHYMPIGIYCAGDTIDYDEPFTPAGEHIGPFRGDEHGYTDRQIDGYIEGTRPYALTPYLFVPVGCDFQRPKDRLIEYLDGYDTRRYPASGAYAVAATFEDYAQLVLAHSEALPEIQADLTPYFTGFLGSRAGVKRAVRDAARPFFAAETFAVALGDEGKAALAGALPVLEELTRADHHDFVTGTSTDEVVRDEQLPLAARAQDAGRAALSRVAAALAARLPDSPQGTVARVLALNPSGVARSAIGETVVSAVGPLHGSASIERLDGGRVRVLAEDMPPFSWRAIDLLAGDASTTPGVALEMTETGAVVFNARVRAEIAQGALVSLRIDGVEALTGPSFTLREYDDGGGLWRLGHESPGCKLSLAAQQPAPGTLEVLEHTDLTVRLALRSEDAVRELRLDAGSAGLDLALETAATRAQTTRTVSFALPGKLTTALAGGSIERAGDKIYAPTYWPAVSWAMVPGWALLLRQSTGVHQGDVLELLAVRNTLTEQCDVEGGQGTDTAVHRIEWRLERAASPAEAEALAQAWNRPLELLEVPASGDGTLPPELSLLQPEGAGIVSALKPAERGSGVIVRALLEPGPLRVKLSPLLLGRQLFRADAAERDLASLGAAGDALLFDSGGLQTVRLK